MVQEEQKIISLLSEPLKIAGFDLIEVKVGMMDAQKTIQLYIDSPNSIQIDDCANVNQITKNIFGKIINTIRIMCWKSLHQEYSGN